MLNKSPIVARKEIIDGLRDIRSVVSPLLYALMGPIVVGMVAMGIRTSAKTGAGGAVLAGMMSVFTLVAAFVGGMNVAMDTVAGERERRSMLPLLLNPVTRLDVAAGKWLAVAFFSVAGLIVNLLGFVGVFAISGMRISEDWPRLLTALAIGILPLALLAASVQLLISTVCRSVKEAQTYLSMIVFLPMGLGMFLVFFPEAASGWFSLLTPVVGQQLELQLMMGGGRADMPAATGLGLLTTALAALVLLSAASRLRRDDVIAN